MNFGGACNKGAVQSYFAPGWDLPGNVQASPGEYVTERLTAEAIRFIEQNKSRPFYVQLWHFAPHAPIEAPRAVVEKYRRKREKLGDKSLNPTYAAMLEVVDQGVAKIVEAK